MNIANKMIKWKYRDVLIDTITVNADKDVINSKTKSAIIDALNNTPNPILQVDWSKFGKDGDCIIVEDINIE